ncbi:hypothetical protein [Hyunsoonleella rubra]|uniref:Uncharacterized protein n=1 Tax=Hyunsoonleella rubra TaxID=1737062 RepID=A0ABW5TFQ6_9FLAO
MEGSTAIIINLLPAFFTFLVAIEKVVHYYTNPWANENPPILNIILIALCLVCIVIGALLSSFIVISINVLGILVNAYFLYTHFSLKSD